MLKDDRTQSWSGLHTRFVIALTRWFSAETWNAIHRAVVASIISLCTLGVASQKAAAQTYVQGNFATPPTAQTTVTVPYNAAQTAGNFNLVIVGWNDTTALISSVTDTKGNTYSLAGTPTVLAGRLSQSIYYAKNIAAAAAGANGVKVTFTAAAVFPDIRVLEYSGIDPVNPLDVAVGASGISATSNSGSVQTTNATDLLVGANVVETSTSGPGTGFTLRLNTPDGDIAEDRVVTAAGSYSAGAPLAGSGGWVMQLVAFKASSGGGGGSGAQVTGQWQTLPYQMPINPIRVGLLHTGQIVIISGSENNPAKHSAGTSVGALWDLKVPSITVIPMLWDVFCDGGSFLADGRCMAFGGTSQYDPFLGEPRTTVFDPLTDLFNQLQEMSDGRWYATAITLGDGRVMVFSGYGSNGNVNQNVEFYTVGTGFSAPYLANWTPSLYPWLHLLPNGKVFCSGYFSPSRMFDPSSPGSNWQASAPTVYGFQRLYGSSVLLPLLPANNYAPRVMILGGDASDPNATATTEIIDLSKTNPAWVDSGNMPSGARMEGNSVLLPNGKLLVQGGSAVDEVASTATLGADLFDPSTGLWSSAGKATYPRLYHSVALLLPDATVATAGSNPVRGTYDPHIEIYSPAYLFTTDANGNTIPATRPTITSSPTNIGYAGSFQVQTPNAANISSVVLIRPGSDTHAFDMDQRLVGLTFTAGSGVLNVTGPPNQNIAPPGYYMLFLVNSAGVPSIANFVQVSNSPADQPPKGTITSPATNPLNISLNQSVNFAGTATDADGTVARQQWIFPEGTPLTSPNLNAGSVLFSQPGTYVASLTAVDNLGVNDPSPPTRTINVSTGGGGTIPSVTASGATNVTATTATLNGSILSNGNQMITSDGFEYGTTTSYGTPVAATTVQSGAFSANITGLTKGTTYHYRATGVNASGTGVSPDSQFRSKPK